MIDTYDIATVAKIFNTSDSTILQLAESGDLPAAKIGKCWVFEKNLTYEYLIMQINLQTSSRREKYLFNTKEKINTTLTTVRTSDKNKYPLLPN